MAIDAYEIRLGKVFSTDYRFIIPSFQRPYSWRRENMLELIGDLEDAARTPERPYFLGSLILVKSGGNGSRAQERQYQVIDGQQRLTSLSILIAVLRDLETDEELLRDLDALLLEQGNKLQGIKAEPRLTLREKDAGFFREYVQENNLEGLFALKDTELTSNAQRNIYENTRAAYDEFCNRSTEERRAFARYLVDGVCMIIVSTDDLAGAHRIFNVMNVRGLPLTAQDMLKAKAISSLPPADRDDYGKRWDDAIDLLGESAEPFFDTMITIIDHGDIGHGDSSPFAAGAFDRYFNTHPANEFVGTVLEPYAHAWLHVTRQAQDQLPEPVSEAIQTLCDYGDATEWYPAAMWILVHKLDVQAVHVSAPSPSDDQITAVSAMLRALERVTGVDNLINATSSARKARVARIVADLDSGTPAQQSAALSVNDNERHRALLRLRGELYMNPNLKKVLLLRANDQLNGSRVTRPRALYPVRILPERIGPTSSFAAWPESIRDHWVDRIGNLALSQTNETKMEQLDGFSSRRDRILSQSGARRFPLSEQLADIQELTPETLNDRQNTTVRLIAQYWDIQFDADHTDLTAVSEERLARGNGSPSRGSKRITIAQVVEAGFLLPDERLVWKRPRLGEEWYATVTGNGTLRLDNGQEYASPSAAVKGVTGKNGSNGLAVWRRVSDGSKLADIWKAFRMSHHA